MPHLKQNLNLVSRVTLTAGKLALAFALWAAPSLLAQAPAAQQTSQTPQNRWLLVVDTSRRMEARKDGIVKTVTGLIMSGMNGQMRRGDTLGIWTFNEKLYSGLFPLQDCVPEQS